MSQASFAKIPISKATISVKFHQNDLQMESFHIYATGRAIQDNLRLPLLK